MSDREHSWLTVAWALSLLSSGFVAAYVLGAAVCRLAVVPEGYAFAFPLTFISLGGLAYEARR